MRTIDAATFALAFCSVVYELLLGQAMSAFLGNTVLRYSVTIGLYLLAMGIGAALVRGRLTRAPLLSLQFVELALTVCGALSLPLLFAVDAFTQSGTAVSATGHTLVIVIGILTGTEIPLLMALRERVAGRSMTTVLAVDYVGAFAGTLAFAFWFYPRVGLTGAVFVVALVNAAVGLWISRLGEHVPDAGAQTHGLVRTGQAVAFLALLVCWIRSAAIDEALLGAYLGGSSS